MIDTAGENQEEPEFKHETFKTFTFKYNWELQSWNSPRVSKGEFIIIIILSLFHDSTNSKAKITLFDGI